MANLAYGSRKNPVRTNWVIGDAQKQFVKEIGRRANTSDAVALEMMLNYLESETPENGLPSWWPVPDQEGKLPIRGV